MRTDELLRSGVAHGIITEVQERSLLALDAPDSTGREAARGFNAVTVAYGVGALVVLFAFGWFLVDRWNVLGDAGLLGVSLLYAVLFAIAAFVLAREGFPVAHGLAVLLAVGMTPLAVRALGRLVPFWPTDALALCGGARAQFFPCDMEALTMELTAAAAALAMLRRVRFGPLVIPVAIAGLLIPAHLVRAWLDVEWGSAMVGWTALLTGSLLLAVAYAVDRQRETEDYAAWLHVAAAVAGLVACVQLFDAYPELRHLAAPVAVLSFVGAVYLRRRVYLVAGVFLAFLYLTWLAVAVFRVTVAFPLVLAVIGLSIIVAAVLLQRRFPALVARAGGSAGPPRFPGGIATLLAPALLAALMLPDGGRRDTESRLNRAAHVRAMRGSMRNSGRARGVSPMTRPAPP
ncbi:MAG: hypothetical protein ACHQQ3_07785 [Gemmatimonadales bacterium]